MSGPQLAYACWCRDGQGSNAKRDALRPVHLAHIEAHVDRFFAIGPLKDGDLTVGSLMIVKADSVDDARNLLAQDPYFGADIWESIEIEPFLAVAGDWLGGIAWK